MSNAESSCWMGVSYGGNLSYEILLSNNISCSLIKANVCLIFSNSSSMTLLSGSFYVLSFPDVSFLSLVIYSSSSSSIVCYLSFKDEAVMISLLISSSRFLMMLMYLVWIVVSRESSIFSLLTTCLISIGN